ncbi:hypothetical protein ACFVGM_17960 [Kitasatospora purpeofusca]|uniref:hypothetical protein n=1 Tax=Kitasatospora purpeofusca TaxID=67352 RepID=UPI0036808549
MQNSPSRSTRSPRTAWVAALAAAALLGLTSPTGHATSPEEAIETGQSYYLIATNHGNRGVTFEVDTNNDWALLTNSENGNGTAVVLDAKDAGYTIRSTSSDWPGYDTWCSVDKGIKLGRADGCATTWKMVPGDDGFKLEDRSRRTVAHKTSGKAWLGPATEIYSGHAYTTFKLVKA